MSQESPSAAVECGNSFLTRRRTFLWLISGECDTWDSGRAARFRNEVAISQLVANASPAGDFKSMSKRTQTSIPSRRHFSLIPGDCIRCDCTKVVSFSGHKLWCIGPQRDGGDLGTVEKAQMLLLRHSFISQIGLHTRDAFATNFPTERREKS